MQLKTLVESRLKSPIKSKEHIIENLIRIRQAEDTVSVKQTELVKIALRTFPPEILNLLNDSNCKVILARSLDEENPRLATSKLPDYSEESRLRNATSMFSRGNIYVFAFYFKDGTEIENAVTILATRHEIGHAVDFYLGKISENIEFEKVHEEDRMLLSPEQRISMRYFTRAKRGAKETIADLIAYKFGNSMSPRCTSVHRNFRECAKLLDYIFECVDNKK